MIKRELLTTQQQTKHAVKRIVCFLHQVYGRADTGINKGFKVTSSFNRTTYEL